MKKITIFISIITLFLVAQTCFAVDLLLDYPKIGNAELKNVSTIPGLIKYIYTFSMIAAGITAFISILIGGVRYVMSAGDASKAGDARDQMTQAVLGLIILLAAFLILKTINPDLVNLRFNTNSTNFKTACYCLNALGEETFNKCFASQDECTSVTCADDCMAKGHRGGTCSKEECVTTSSKCNIPSDCNDQNTCTTDNCNSGTCTHQPVSAACPSPDMVTCGTKIASTNNCGECAGTGTQCASGQICNNGQCTSATPSCKEGCDIDAKQCSGNGYQICGNFDEDPCREWGSVQACDTGKTCKNNTCSDLPSHCSNNVRDRQFVDQYGASLPQESDTDCGGVCAKCETNGKCNYDWDCVSGKCGSAGKCLPAHCADGKISEDEADTDCGGATCDSCSFGSKCKARSDCGNEGTCYEGKCKNVATLISDDIGNSNDETYLFARGSQSKAFNLETSLDPLYTYQPNGARLRLSLKYNCNGSISNIKGELSASYLTYNDDLEHETYNFTTNCDGSVVQYHAPEDWKTVEFNWNWTHPELAISFADLQLTAPLDANETYYFSQAELQLLNTNNNVIQIWTPKYISDEYGELKVGYGGSEENAPCEDDKYCDSIGKTRCGTYQKSCPHYPTYVTCGYNDADSCLDWGAETSCPQGQSCEFTYYDKSGQCTVN